MNKTLISFFCFFCLFPIHSQSQTTMIKSYGVENNMPVFYQALKQSLTFPMAWGNSPEKNFQRWRVKARKTLMSCMENIISAPKSFDMKIVDVEQRKGYKAEKIFFNVSAWSRIPAYILVPDGKGPFPAILMLHDHGAHFSIGKEKMIRPFDVDSLILKDADHWSWACYGGQYPGDYYASHGYVVLAIDALFWGERGRKEGVDYNGQQALASNLLQLGTSWGSVITMDDVHSADFLSSLSFVDSLKVGCLGHSMGGYRSWMLSAVTDKVKASASICWMNTTDSLMTLTNNQNKGGSAYSMIIPGIRRFMDYSQVAAIACPKPALFFNGYRDKLFPVEGVKAAYSEMRKVWDSQHADDCLVTKIWDEKHYFNKEMQRETLAFFNHFFYLSADKDKQ